MRPGRLDRLLYVPLPDEETRRDIFRLRLERVPTNSDVAIEELVRMTEMYSGAEVSQLSNVCVTCTSPFALTVLRMCQVTAVCNEAAIGAMQENIEIAELCRRHFISAIQSVKPQTTVSMVKHYEDYAKGLQT